MIIYKMTETELQFAELIWANEPMGSGELVALAATHLNWKKSTTYTVLRKLCEQGIFANTHSVVTALVGRDEYRRLLGEAYLEQNYNGSLPGFVAAFVKKRRLSKQDIEELKALIEQYDYCNEES